MLSFSTSDAIFKEYVDVLNRDKFSKIVSFKSNADIVLHKLTEISSFYQPDQTVDILKDMDDNEFLELAVASSANYLITGNINDFTISSFGNTQIISPAGYWIKIAPEGFFILCHYSTTPSGYCIVMQCREPCCLIKGSQLIPIIS